DESNVSDTCGALKTVAGLFDVSAVAGGAAWRSEARSEAVSLFCGGSELFSIIPRILGAQAEADVDARGDGGDGASDDDGDPGGFLASDWVGCGGVGGLEFRQGAGFAGGWGRL